MAANDVAAWIPEEFSSDVIKRVMRTSAVEALARAEPMTTKTKSVPRSAGMDVATVAASAAYGEDTSTNDEVVLTARKMGRALRIAEEDMGDSLVAILDQKRGDWFTSWAKFFDNATLAVTAAENGTTIPFTSLYRALANENGNGGYASGDNITQTGSAGPTYDGLSTVVGLYEDSDYYDEDRTVVIASPVWKRALRDIKDDQNRPIFVAGQGGDGGTPDSLFGYPVQWSLGCRTSATAAQAPTGNPLLIVGNRDYLVNGKRSGPESMVAGGDAAFLTDEALLKCRVRRGFKVGEHGAFSIYEDDR